MGRPFKLTRFDPGGNSLYSRFIRTLKSERELPASPFLNMIGQTEELMKLKKESCPHCPSNFKTMSEG